MNDTTRPGYSRIGDTETGVCMDGAGTIDDNRPEKVEDKINILAKEKQTDANSEIYYAMHSSKNRIPTMPDKINKIFIPISLQLNI